MAIRKGPRPGAIALLKADHRAVEKLFRSFERSSESAYESRRALAGEIIAALSGHTAIEEQLFYPAVRRTVYDVDSNVLEAMEEHHVAEWLVSQIARTDPTDERFTPKVTVLIENVRRHMREEERILFPELRTALGRKRLRELGAQLVASKDQATTHPLPGLPGSSQGTAVPGALAGAIDLARDKVPARNR